MTRKDGTARGTALGTAYWRIWWANTVSSVGDGALVSALPLLAVTITKDARLISVVSAASYLPWLLLSLPAGVLADRYDRAALMWRSQVFQCAVVAVLAVLVAVRMTDIALLAACGFCLNAAEAVFANASQSVLPQVVPADGLPRANGNLQVSLTVGETFLGPPLGSVAFAAARALPFGLDAASFAGSAALLARLPRSASRIEGGSGTGAGRFWSQMAEGLRWLSRQRLLRAMALLVGVSNFASQMGQAVLVLLATEKLHTGSVGYGLLWTASAVGAIGGGLVNPVLTRRIGEIPSMIVSMAAIAGVYVGIGLAPDALAAGSFMVCNGFVVTMWNVVTVSLRQRVVPARLLGRVNSAYRMIGWGLMPAGALAGGFVAHALGVRAAYTLGGIVCGVTLLAVLPVFLRARASSGASAQPENSPAGRPDPDPPARRADHDQGR
jgi:MFS family permease